MLGVGKKVVFLFVSCMLFACSKQSEEANQQTQSSASGGAVAGALINDIADCAGYFAATSVAKEASGENQEAKMIKGISLGLIRHAMSTADGSGLSKNQILETIAIRNDLWITILKGGTSDAGKIKSQQQQCESLVQGNEQIAKSVFEAINENK